jgi:Mg/Co/Ni transporter MgtE
VIKLCEIIARDPETEISLIMNTKIATLSPETPIQSILYHQEWVEYYSLPVVDQTSLFLGAIRLETIRSILVKSDNKIEELGQTAINALGELYQIGLSGLLKSATDFNSGLSKD